MSEKVLKQKAEKMRKKQNEVNKSAQYYYKGKARVYEDAVKRYGDSGFEAWLKEQHESARSAIRRRN